MSDDPPRRSNPRTRRTVASARIVQRVSAASARARHRCRKIAPPSSCTSAPRDDGTILVARPPRASRTILPVEAMIGTSRRVNRKRVRGVPPIACQEPGAVSTRCIRKAALSEQHDFTSPELPNPASIIQVFGQATGKHCGSRTVAGITRSVCVLAASSCLFG